MILSEGFSGDWSVGSALIIVDVLLAFFFFFGFLC